MAGRVVLESFQSRVLVGNRPGDTATRTVPVYLPPSYDSSERRYPVAFVLTGFTGRGRMLLNDNPWSPALHDRMDAMIARGVCDEMILVMPDCFTRYGGSQYLNSTATGHYMDHVVDELVPWIDSRYRTLAHRDHRGVAGKSSGGYGALMLGMSHPDTFGAIVCHSGDMYFEYCYRGDIPKLCAKLQAAGGLTKWFESFEAAVQKKHEELTALNILAMAAAYSPNPDAELGIDLPCDPETGAFRDDVWRRWLEVDPMNVMEKRVDVLEKLRLFYLDCGVRDEFHLQIGARLFTRRLRELGITHEYHEFDDGHMNVSYRYEVSLPKLARALSSTGVGSRA